MNRLAAFGLICAAAVLFIFVAYEKLVDVGFLTGPEMPRYRTHLVSTKTGKFIKDYSKATPNTAQEFTRKIGEPVLGSQTISRTKADAVIDEQSSSDISSSVDEASVNIDTQEADHVDHANNTHGAENVESDVHMVSENDKKPIHIIVLARMRTGSSLVGEILNQNPTLFYIFEPLHAIDSFIRRHREAETHRRELSVTLLRMINRCQFTQDFVQSIAHWGLGKHKSSGLQPICKATEGCNKASHTLIEDQCKSFAMRMGMKTIRADLSMLQSLVEKDNVNLKIIHLVRDPRGTANSRKNYYIDHIKAERKKNKQPERTTQFTLKTLGLLDVNPQFHVNTIPKYCKWIKDTIPVAKSKPDWLQSRYMLVRYEDLALDPVKVSQDIYNFVGLTMPKNVRQWVVNSTSESNNRNNGSTFGTQKNSKEVMQSWRHSLPYEEVRQVQDLCGDAMKLVGYRQVLRREDLTNYDFDTIVPIPA